MRRKKLNDPISINLILPRKMLEDIDECRGPTETRLTFIRNAIAEKIATIIPPKPKDDKQGDSMAATDFPAKPAYYTIQIGDAETTEADDFPRAKKKYDTLCAKHPEREIRLCEVWIRPILIHQAEEAEK